MNQFQNKLDIPLLSTELETSQTKIRKYQNSEGKFVTSSNEPGLFKIAEIIK